MRFHLQQASLWSMIWHADSLDREPWSERLGHLGDVLSELGRRMRVRSRRIAGWAGRGLLLRWPIAIAALGSLWVLFLLTVPLFLLIVSIGVADD